MRATKRKSGQRANKKNGNEKRKTSIKSLAMI